MRKLTFNYWLMVVCIIVLATMFSCSSKRTISPEEAKGMILQYLSSPEATMRGMWVTNSRNMVENIEPIRMADGTIVVGPWVVDPNGKTVSITVERAEFNGAFSLVNDEYVISDVTITEVFGRK